MSYCRNIRRLGIIKGIVTEVNKSLLYFEVDDRIRIYVDITKPFLNFPAINEPVEISDLVKYDVATCTGVIGPNTKQSFSSVTSHTTQNEELHSVLQANNICGSDEVLAMDRIIRKLSRITSGASLSKCLKSLLCAVIVEHKKSFQNIEIKLPTDLNFVNRTNEDYTFMRYDGLCNYNVYPSDSSETPGPCVEYLFGILDVDKVYGCFSLTYKSSKIFVRFRLHTDDLHKLKDTLVMIKKWTVFSEIFDIKNEPTLKFIVIDFKDVVTVESLAREPVPRFFYRKDEEYRLDGSQTIFFQINRISEVIFGYYNVPEIWMEGFLSPKGPLQSTRLWAYIICTNLCLKPFLKEGMVYKLIFLEPPTQLQLDTYRELFGLRGAKHLYKLDPNTVFQESNELPNFKSEIFLNDFHAIKGFLSKAEPNQFFSFSLKISSKQLQENKYKSWFPRRHQNVLYFGTADDKYQMRLVFREKDSEEFLDLYFSNRDNHLMPLGLIKDMVVEVKHVLSNKNKYIRTTVFSSFEILEYCPRIPYSSVSLSFSSFFNWKWRGKTQSTPLGLYYHLPLNCIVQGSFIFHAIFDLSITPVCQICQRCVVAGRPCIVCKTDERDLHVDMIIYGQDGRNPSFKMDANQDFFYSILGLKSSSQVAYLRNAFYKTERLKVDFCKYSDFKVESCTEDLESREFLLFLVRTIYDHINFGLYCLLDAVCLRKKEGSPWVMIDFEMLHNNTLT